MTIRVVVVDDEELARERVADLVRADSRLELIGEASDGAMALDLVLSLRPDLMFLDIQMPELDGFGVIEALSGERLPAVVFVTAFDQYAIRAFDVDAIDYLLKPVTPERFEAAVERVSARISHVDHQRNGALDALVRAVASRAIDERHGIATRFVVRRGNSHYFVRPEDVDWAEADGNYVRLHTGEKNHLIRDTMNAFEARLDAQKFIRIHRSTIVALDRIRSIEAREQGEYLVITNNGTKLTSSRSYSERVRALLR